MIFEDILSGTLSFDMTTFLSALLIVAAAATADTPFYSDTKSDGFRENISFIKNLFSIATLLSVLSALFFGTAAIKNNDGPRKKRAALSAFLSWFLIAVIGRLHRMIFIYPIFPDQIILSVGAVFTSLAVINILPLPGFLCFSFFKNIFSSFLSEKMEKAEKYTVFFVFLALFLVARSGCLNIILNFVMTGLA